MPHVVACRAAHNHREATCEHPFDTPPKPGKHPVFLDEYPMPPRPSGISLSDWDMAGVRASREARGYGPPHRREREKWRPVVEGGGGVCARCGKPIHPLEPWDLGHDDFDRRMWSGPEHRACNRATAGRRVKREPRSREW